MRVLLLLSAVFSLLVGLSVITAIKSDIQVQIVATCLIGSMLLFGQASIIKRQSKLMKELEKPAGK